MKKFLVTIILSCLLAPLSMQAYKIEKDEIDEFNGTRYLVTSWESICKYDIHFRFRLENGRQNFDVRVVYENPVRIDTDDALQFKSYTDSIFNLYSTRITFSGRGEGAVGINKSGMEGFDASYSNPDNNLSWFNQNTVRLMRFHSTSGHFTFKVSENDGMKITELYQIFATAIGAPVTKITSKFHFVFKKCNVGSDKWKVVKEETKEVTQKEAEEIAQEWKRKSPSWEVRDVVITVVDE